MLPAVPRRVQPRGACTLTEGRVIDLLTSAVFWVFMLTVVAPAFGGLRDDD
jgi:hypothetical protein